MGFPLCVSGIEGDDGSDVVLGISLIDVLVVVGFVHCSGVQGKLGMLLLDVFEEWDGLGVVWDFSGGHNDFDGEMGEDVYNEMDFVSEEGVSLCFMSPSSIRIGIRSETVALVLAGADFDAELVGVSPDVGGIDRCVDLFLDETHSDRLCDELMKDGIERIGFQSGAELREDRVGGSIEEVEATEELQSDVELQFVGQVSLGGSFPHIDQEQRFEHADGRIGVCSLV